MFLTREARIRYLGFDDHWAIVLGVPTLAALASVIFVAGQELPPSALGVCMVMSLLHTSLYWWLNRRGVVYLRANYPLSEQTLRRIIFMLAYSATLVIVIEGTLNGLVFPRLAFLEQAGYGKASLLFEACVALTLCLLVLAIYESVYFFSRYRHSVLEQERLTRTNVQAQLEILKQQVNPHFLFNSLNTLVQVIPEDPPKAVLFTQRLSAVYRRILEYRQRDLITLTEEIKALEDYIFLMQTRFEDKLRIVWSGAGAREQSIPEPESQDAYIVPLSLQLIVENAIKHNVVSQECPLTIEIAVSPDTVTVTNNLQPRSQRQVTTGWGQQNIRQRYRLTGDREMTVVVTPTHYRVSLPLVRVKSAAAYVTA
ncbi:histidine kinase [Neolewinella xylanilytica]|uniref:Histidine kinase n=1 Tax=Neolewinella xylanilytica TaxID=1514080 RepID=A0A2S6I3I0_9BACT|nr:histidine kinase [Neolewinella xylanilytica]PPK85619.1 histidine kinase [Neolewinella xylanilytica]